MKIGKVYTPNDMTPTTFVLSTVGQGVQPVGVEYRWYVSAYPHIARHCTSTPTATK